MSPVRGKIQKLGLEIVKQLDETIYFEVTHNKQDNVSEEQHMYILKGTNKQTKRSAIPFLNLKDYR